MDRDELIKTVDRMLEDGVTLNQVSDELEYRDNSSGRWDDDLYEYETSELEDIETEFMRRM